MVPKLSSLAPWLASSLVLFISVQAMGLHAYRSEVCHAKDYHLVYSGGYAVGGHFDLTDLVSGVVTRFYEPMDQTGNEDNLLLLLSAKELSRKVEPVTCVGHGVEFETTELSLEKVIKFKLGVGASRSPLVHDGEVVTFACDVTLDAPVICP